MKHKLNYITPLTGQGGAGVERWAASAPNLITGMGHFNSAHRSVLGAWQLLKASMLVLS